MVCLILFNKFLDVLSAFTCAQAIDNLWIICLEIKFLKLEWSEKPLPLVLLEIFCYQKHLKLFLYLQKDYISF